MYNIDFNLKKSFYYKVIQKEREQYIALLLRQLQFLKGNCCEIGSGEKPSLSKLVLPEILKNKKTLTIYDPEIAENLSNTTIHQKKFTKESDISNIDTLFGLFPCEASITMIDKAILENKNLLLAFCSCNLGTAEHRLWLAEDICTDYQKIYGSQIEIQQWPEEYEIETPIMIRKRQL